jgi:hypothetical protein
MHGIFWMNLGNMNKFFQNVIARSPGGTVAMHEANQSVDRGRSIEIELNLNGLLRFARNDVLKKSFWD